MTFSNAAYRIGNIWAAQAQAQLQSQAVRLQPMYVIVGDGHIFGFGLTPKKAMEHFLHGLWYDGPRLDTRPCSPALYRQLQALDRKGLPFVDCRINRKGVAVCRKDMPRKITRRKD
jgi:hypothetical protein